MQKISDKDKVIAIIFKKEDIKEEGTNFCTPDDFSLQLGMLAHKSGKIIKPHKHKLVKREIFQTQEVLFLMDGKIKVDLYNESNQIVNSVVLTSGDFILLASGGHGIEILEDSNIIEVKQGPYIGLGDKEFISK